MNARWTSAIVAVFFFPQFVSAVVINSPSGAGNTSAPPDDPGWANVGMLAGATGTYIGWGWVLTAAHVGAGTITLNGLSYEEEPGTAVQLSNNTPGQSLLTDLVLYRLKSTPEGIAPLTLASTPSAPMRRGIRHSTPAQCAGAQTQSAQAGFGCPTEPWISTHSQPHSISRQGRTKHNPWSGTQAARFSAKTDRLGC